MKAVQDIQSAARPHWVGDGFPVRSMFSYNTHGSEMSPFLLLDYAGPYTFEPSTSPRGVGRHPHRGFETVTIVYEGEVAHRDSTGAGGTIGPGDVQWMTAASGILHEEFHSPEFGQRGGVLKMIQLWVNLPAADKIGPPGYQTILNQDIPVVELAGGAGQARIIAGSLLDAQGPARTHTPMNVWDVQLKRGTQVELPAPKGWTTAVIVLKGTVRINGSAGVGEAQMILLDREGENVALAADDDTTLLLLSGEPIQEPIVGYGPFVMNTQEEIAQAFADFNSGRFGQISA